MAIIRVSRSAGYVTVHASSARDKNLSLEAKGLMFYLLTRPDNWEVRNTDLCNMHGVGKHRLARILGELKKHGYVVRTRQPGEGGRFVWITTVYESPQDLTLPASTTPASTTPASTPPASTPPASTTPASTPPASTTPASTMTPKTGDGEATIARFSMDGGPGDITNIDLNYNNKGGGKHEWLQGTDTDIQAVGSALFALTQDRGEFADVWEFCRIMHEALQLPAPLAAAGTDYITQNWLSPALTVVRWGTGIPYGELAKGVLGSIRNGYSPRNIKMLVSNCEQYVALCRRNGNGSGGGNGSGNGKSEGVVAFYAWFNAPPDQRRELFVSLPDGVRNAIRARGPENIRNMTENQLSWFVKEIGGSGSTTVN